jgi:hypothetical protein
METKVLSYSFQTVGLANPDGTLAAATTNLTQVTGPGDTALGPRPAALHYGAGSRSSVTFSPGLVDPRQFCIRMLFRATEAVAGRQNLLESTALPIAVYLDAGESPNQFNVVASIHNRALGWTGPATRNRLVFGINQWYLLDVIYDLDTIAIAIDGNVLAVMAFPDAGLAAASGDKLFIGTWVDGTGFAFRGDIAGLDIYSGLPIALDSLLDDKRSAPEWYLTFKYNQVRRSIGLGTMISDFYYDGTSRCVVQPYQHGQIMFNPSLGTALEIHGDIYQLYKNDPGLRATLGQIASDEIDGAKPGSRKSYFEKGAIYWSPLTGAQPVTGQIYLDYEVLGEGRSPIGLPIGKAESIAGGLRQTFESGKMYFRNGLSNAFEVHGAILVKYEASGGYASWGYPVSHETDVRNGRSVVGKYSNFERSSIYWSAATGAHLIYGAIRDEYRDRSGGPTGVLGFPTSSEADIPGAGAGARYNTFQNGSITWFNGSVYVCTPFRFALGSLDTREEDQDIFDVDGQNDLYANVTVSSNGRTLFDKKIPEGATHFSSANRLDLAYNVPFRVVPNDPGYDVTLAVKVMESDSGNVFGGSDDHLGTFTKTLSMANAWGLRENTEGLFSTGAFGAWVNNLNWSVKPEPAPDAERDFFSVSNRGTSLVDYREYAEAFEDVDPDFEVGFDIVEDGLKGLYYECFVKNVAANGNCFGMSLEAVYAQKGSSRLSPPLKRFSTWGNVENDFNVKHIYQCGADSIYWFLGQFMSGKTSDPVAVFHDSFDRFSRNMDPVICISQNSDFTGAPHCILPYQWKRPATGDWEIVCFDPNRQNIPQTIRINPTTNTFTYVAGSSYTGGARGGGRLYYIPYSVLNHRTHTPMSDLFSLSHGSVLVFAGSATRTASLTDSAGRNINATIDTAPGSPKNKFVSFKGSNGAGPFSGEMFVRRTEAAPLLIPLHPILPGQVLPKVSTLTKRDLIALSKFASLAQADTANAGFQPSAALALNPAIASKNFIHSLVGLQNGKLDYHIQQPLSGMRFTTTTAKDEVSKVAANSLGTMENNVSFETKKDKRIDFSAHHRLGAKGDQLRVMVNGLPASPNVPVVFHQEPGLRQIDIMAGGTPVDAVITIESIVNGKKKQGIYNTSLEGPSRIVLADLLNSDQIKVGKIDNLMGGLISSKMVPRR